ncbi:PP2C family protein-serine/threonine phosphatase [Kitasatospora sp. MBT63]|uniref:PP2C family protein-serine/threonine phosphatase n=1 Tax=Kitasatospora sp. MBT63 TaxID=1444768 RepID=UPI00053A8272|nr:PP2C family protein-serine/threonine phosphatase [Kitasatospora sp. MBT63]
MASDDESDARLPPAASPRWGRFILGAYVLITLVLLVDLFTGPRLTFSPLLAAVPVLAGTGTRRPWVPLAAGGVALAAVGVLAVLNGQVGTGVHAASAAAVATVAVSSSASVALVADRERRLAQLRSVAEAAQQALLRPVAPRIGGLRAAVRYAPAAAEARIGGDLYAVLDSPFGVRVLLGDVRGKGLGAVETAADVLGVFREAAVSEADLGRIAGRLDATVARRPGDEEFVTAVLVSVPEHGSASLVNCGHPAPLLRTRHRVDEVDPPAWSPPLALLGLTGGCYPVQQVPLGPGDLLLLYTDGVSEARDTAGVFYPLAERLSAMPAGEGPEPLLDRLLADVRAYTPHGLDDDAALLALARPARPG